MSSGITDWRAESTTKGVKHGLAVFEEYLNQAVTQNGKTFEECDELYLCNIDTLNNFAEWLLNGYRNLLEEEMLKSGTALQYLSGHLTNNNNYL